MLIGWQAVTLQALEGVPYTEIAKWINDNGDLHISRQVVTNYLTLTKQQKFDLRVIKKINDFVVKHKALQQELAPSTTISV